MLQHLSLIAKAVWFRFAVIILLLVLVIAAVGPSSVVRADDIPGGGTPAPCTGGC